MKSPFECHNCLFNPPPAFPVHWDLFVDCFASSLGCAPSGGRQVAFIHLKDDPYDIERLIIAYT